MRRWIQRIRGAIGMGLTWAVGWAPVGAITGLVTGLVLGFPIGGIAVNYAQMFGVLGFVGGTVFSTLVRITEGHRRFDELSLPRFALLGTVGGLTLGTLAVAINVVGLGGITPLTTTVVVATGLLGAGSAASTLALARHVDDQELLEAGQAAGEVGLTEDERRQFLSGTE